MEEEECSRTAQHHPLHLLDDLLASLSSTEPISISQDNGSSAYQNNKNSHHDNTKEKVDTDPLAIAEARQDLVLRAADDLFANNLTLLENALALLDEQEQYQREHSSLNDSGASGNDDGMPPPVIRKIVAKRSGRSCVLVRKQRNKKSSNSSNNTKENDNTKKKKQCEMDEYYLCIMGRDTFDHHSLLCDNSSGCWAKIQRKGAHCTCRSFSQNIKGGNSSSGRASFSPSVKSSGGDAASTTTGTTSSLNNIVICKHLLAAILMPFMLPWSKPDCGVQEEIVDDREFAKFVMRASIG